MIQAKTVLALFALLAVSAPWAAEAGALTGVWTACPKGPTINECMVKSLEKLFPVMVKGIPAYDIPVLDPIEVGTVDYSTKDLKMVTKNAVMKGLFTNSKIVLVEADPDKFSLRVNMKVPEIVNEGEYELGGKLLMMPVSGAGHFTLKYTDVSLDLAFSGKGETRDGKTYMVLEDVKVVLVPGGLEAKVENLFNGNKELSDNFHKFVNENWKEIFDDSKEKMWAALGQFFKKSFTKLYHDVPYEEIYS
ncbi:circadian clock-controlled protein-like [Thrips palmi]|uniref:Circadian clock-controlled protein-like n=1 Tax=Thrips palmi TaxID=161013 RepID=A0A6P8ZDI6_THRPL|nr:circadian clock-controlled protein-like [Thrips palmi]